MYCTKMDKSLKVSTACTFCKTLPAIKLFLVIKSDLNHKLNKLLINSINYLEIIEAQNMIGTTTNLQGKS